MTNPAEEFLKEKRAFGMGGAASALKGAGRALAPLGQSAVGAIGAGAGAAAFMGLVGGAGKLYSAATKSRDFRNMLEANPDLREHQQQDPAGFNRLFTSLRSMAPEFSKEPMVAGHYMRQGMEGPVEGRGQVSVQAMNARKPLQTGPVSEAALQGFMKGMGNKKDPPRDLLQRQVKTRSEWDEAGNERPVSTEETAHYYGK